MEETITEGSTDGMNQILVVLSVMSFYFRMLEGRLVLLGTTKVGGGENMPGDSAMGGTLSFLGRGQRINRVSPGRE